MSYSSESSHNIQLYDNWFSNYPYAYESELSLVKSLLTDFDKGLEIGVGTGRFAANLGIRTGLEPSITMAETARSRGIRVVEGTAEAIPFENNSFDFVLMINVICFISDLEKALAESFRVIEPGGFLILGFIDGKSPSGQAYQDVRFKGLMCREPWFYSVREVSYLLTKTGFENLDYAQTIFMDFQKMTEPDRVKKGFGEGAVIAIRAQKELE